MYAVIDIETGINLSMEEQLRYIKKADNGCFVSATAEDATGVTINGGCVYNLVGRGGIEDAVGTVVVSEINAGTLMAQLEAQADYIAMMADVDLDVLTAPAEADTESEGEDNE